MKTSNLRLLTFALTVASTLAIITTVFAHEDDGKPRIPKADEAKTYAPSLVPDRIILTWTDDPSTTQAVTWRTSVEATKGVAEIAVAGSGPDFVKESKSFKANSQALLSDISTAHFHTVQFKDLTPKTKYAYRVGDGVNWSEWFHFTTASDKPDPFSFIYFGDAQNDVRSMWSRVIREAYGDAPDASFFIHAGDLINSAEADAEWGQWFAAGKWLNGMIPSVAVPGNHEQGKDADGKGRLTHHWRPTFAFPTNGPVGLEESCYTFVYQGVRFIALDTNRQKNEQAEWLDKILSKNKCRWTICTFHHPIFSTKKDRDNKALRGSWKPIFDKHKVDLVLQGHDHTYGRTGLETPLVDKKGNLIEQKSAENPTDKNVPSGLNKRDEQTGTVYVVSVSGTKMYSMKKQTFMKRHAENTQLYQIIHIDGDQLRFEARTAIGELYDGFTLNKRKGQLNELIEQVPDTPERRLPLEVRIKEAEKKAKTEMEKRDTNKDSKLTRDEVAEDEIEQFEQFDANGDGTVTLEEMTAAFM